MIRPAGKATDLSDRYAPFVFATAQYESGDWDSAPMVPANIIDSLARYTALPVQPQGVTVALASDAILEYPLLYLTGHLPVRFTSTEAEMLRRYLARGGLLFVDDHNHDVDGVFHATVREEIRRVAGPLAPLSNRHELYRCFFVFDNGPPTTIWCMNSWMPCCATGESACCIPTRTTARSGAFIRTTSGSSLWTTRASPSISLSTP